MTTLQLTFACGDYDRTRAIEDGSVRVDGADVNYLRLPVEETFFRMARYREFDVAEMSMSTYVASLNALDRGEKPPFVALPVYTSRQFRHAGMFINTDAGVTKPSDLRGKRIGLPEMQLTACVWQRGILADSYDLPLGASTFYTGGQEKPGRIEKAAVDLPFDIRRIDDDRTLTEMLTAGDLDALFAPRIPSTYGEPGAPVARLFPDAEEAEKQYFRDTGIFPIMHVVALRREVYEANRWVAQSLTKALNEAKAQAMERIYDASALQLMEPWLMFHLEEARALMGADYWPYGVGDANRTVIETFLRYHHEQGLSHSLRTLDDMFAPESLEEFVI